MYLPALSTLKRDQKKKPKKKKTSKRNYQTRLYSTTWDSERKALGIAEKNRKKRWGSGQVQLNIYIYA